MKICLGKEIEEIKKKNSENEKNLLKNRNSDELNELDADDIYFHSNTIKNIKLGTNTVNRIYLNNSIVYELENTIDLKLFHNLVPKTATEIQFLYASNNPVLTDYKRVGYCDNNNFIEVWEMGTKYILINPRKNYIYSPANCGHFLDGYNKLNTCIFDNFDIRNVHDMQFMFQNCTSLTSLDLSNFNTKNVRYMSYMFAQCGNLTSLDLRNFNTRNVSLFLYMFFLCGKLTTMTASFDITNAINLEAFMYGIKVPNVYLVGNPAKCTTFNGAFENSKIVTISSNSFTIRANATSNNMFKNCTSLVGGNGTTYSPSHITADYARVDGENGLPGYFTAPANK